MFCIVVVQIYNFLMVGSMEKIIYNVVLNFVDQLGIMCGFKYRKYNVIIDFIVCIINFIKVGIYVNLMYGEIEQFCQGQNDVFFFMFLQVLIYMFWLLDDGIGICCWISFVYFFESYNKNMFVIIGDNVMKCDNNFDINVQLWLEINLVKGLMWYIKGVVCFQFNKSKDW